jgi:hypothetical protein
MAAALVGILALAAMAGGAVNGPIDWIRDSYAVLMRLLFVIGQQVSSVHPVESYLPKNA